MISNIKFIFVVILLLPANAFAHLVNQDVGEFYAGMLHPLTSAEHLLPMIAIAFLASQCGKRAGRMTMWVFPVSLAAGIIIGRSAPVMGTAFHLLNLAALIGLGALIVFVHRIQFSTVAAAAGIMGLILGYRSGVDMAAAGANVQFIPGVALTGFIAMTLIAAWVPKANSGWQRNLRQAAGVGFIGAGIVLLVGFMTGGSVANVQNVGMPDQNDLLRLIRTENLSPPLVMGMLMTAFLWGAGHALTPGHGKAIAAAYLVGARSTPWHAVYLGLTVTMTHTFGVICLGLVALFASRYILPEQLYPWLGALSGIIVVAMGVTMLLQRLRFAGKPAEHGHDHFHHHHDEDSHNHSHHDHRHHHDEDGHDHSHHHHHHDDSVHHGHSHLPLGANGESVSWRSLLGLGISGGLVPCPSALVVLLAAVSLGRTGFGLLLVVVFSFGLAAVLTAVGLLFVKGGKLMQRMPGVSVLSRYMPIASAIFIFIIGMMITAGAVSEIAG